MTLVSLIIPSFNHQEYVQEAILSCFEQSYSNIEVIISDDKSNDNTVNVVNETLKLNKLNIPVKFIKNTKNLGSAININHAIKSSSGKYINILNSDDIFHKNRIEKFIQYANQNDYFWGFSGVQFKFEQNISKYNFLELMFYQAYIRNYPSISWGLLDLNFAMSSGNLFFSRKLFDIIGGFADLKYCLDWHFAVRASRLCEPHFLEENLYVYRIHSNNSFHDLDHLSQKESSVVRNVINDPDIPHLNKFAPSKQEWYADC